jgi:four helix bundle protein
MERFEDVAVWKKGRELRRAIYTCSHHGAFGNDFALRDHIRRSAVSVASNIAEGLERGGNKEFIQFPANSKGSCGELRDQLDAALDEQYISADQFEALCRQAIEVSRMISDLMRYLKPSAMRGPKFKPNEPEQL